MWLRSEEDWWQVESYLNTFKYGAQLVQAFGFRTIRHEYAIFSFELVKVCALLSPPWFIETRGISATRKYMESTLVIKFPTLYEW